MGNVCCETDKKTSEENNMAPMENPAGNLEDGDVVKAIPTYSENPHAPANGPLSQHAPEEMSKIEEVMKKLQFSNNNSLIELSSRIEKSDDFRNLPILGPYEDSIHNNVYYGNYKYGRRHGIGTLIWGTDKKFYYGEFKDDQACGKGIQLWENGTYYFGEWLDGRAHGSGVSQDENGVTYEGKFEYDIK